MSILSAASRFLPASYLRPSLTSKGRLPLCPSTSTNTIPRVSPSSTHLLYRFALLVIQQVLSSLVVVLLLAVLAAIVPH